MTSKSVYETSGKSCQLLYVGTQCGRNEIYNCIIAGSRIMSSPQLYKKYANVPLEFNFRGAERDLALFSGSHSRATTVMCVPHPQTTTLRTTLLSEAPIVKEPCPPTFIAFVNSNLQ